MLNNSFSKNDYFSYVLLTSFYGNIGEEIQWVAQSRFLPRIDNLINKDCISKFHPKVPTKMIISGWHTITPKQFVPHKNVIPLLISMFIHRDSYKAFQKPKIKKFLLANAPVGCRDENSHKFLDSIGVPSYYSGCLTLTLQRNPKIAKQDYILAIGLTQEQETYLREHTAHRVMSFDRLVPHIYNRKQRLDIAKAFLALYQSAYCIVTNKMHVALPALALETPVLLINIDKNDMINDPERFVGVKDLCHNVDPSDFILGLFNYDFDNPPQNPNGYLKLRENLIKICSEFTGYNNEESLISITEPFEYIMQMFTRYHNYGFNYWRSLYYIDNKTIIKHLLKKFRGKKGHELK